MAVQQVVAVQDEAQRLAAVHGMHLLDTEPETEFEEAVQLAASLCGTSMSTIAILDEHRQWFKARVGVEACETPLREAICAHVIGREKPLVIPDTLLDTRFREHPAVTSGPRLRFYAGMPLNTSSGLTVGTLCVMDTVPRELSSTQLSALTYIGRQVCMQMELRAKNKLMGEALAVVEEMRAELRSSNQLFRAFMDHSPMVGYMKDADGRLIYYNRPFQERFEIGEDEWIGKNDFELWPAEFAQRFRQIDLSVMDSQAPIVTEESSPSPGGNMVYWRTYKFPVTRGNGAHLVAGLSMDVTREKEVLLELERSHTELHLANERLTELSLTDQLTRLRNRRAFDERLEQEFAISSGTGLPLALIMIDVDRFKSVNDEFGHAAGDEVLSTVARLLVGSCRAADVVARYGGEEFAILLPNTRGAAAGMLASRILATVASYPWRRGAVTVSAGVASWTPECPDAARLTAQADHALYEAKRLGRNRVEVAVEDSLLHSVPS
jgi:diguanylate cyclase (GGDEF)-like protein/PAS domain S-box-containing protein